jgi:hypothetical protein
MRLWPRDGGHPLMQSFRPLVSSEFGRTVALNLKGAGHALQGFSFIQSYRLPKLPNWCARSCKLTFLILYGYGLHQQLQFTRVARR